MMQYGKSHWIGWKTGVAGHQVFMGRETKRLYNNVSVPHPCRSEAGLLIFLTIATVNQGGRSAIHGDRDTWGALCSVVALSPSQSHTREANPPDTRDQCHK